MKICISLLMSTITFMLFPSYAESQTVVTFEELQLAPNSYYNGSDGAGGWSSQGVTFSNSYNATWGSWSGWSYSNVTDTTTPGFTNQYASYAGGGANAAGGVAIGQNFAIATGSRATINLPSISLLQSVDVTNSTYAALSMANGDQFAKKFGGVTGNDPDWFQVTLRGYDGLNATGNQTGSVTVDLADYRYANNAQDFILDDWLTVDLSMLTGVRSVRLEFASSDVGQFGMNTPAYVAMDNLRFSAVPEPTSFALCGVIAAAGWGVQRLRRRKQHHASGEAASGEAAKGEPKSV
ncbi:DUF4465 domain-containing protein [Pirellulaceae bacterium SH467]|jgi:hypothetical protein